MRSKGAAVQEKAVDLVVDLIRGEDAALARRAPASSPRAAAQARPRGAANCDCTSRSSRRSGTGRKVTDTCCGAPTSTIFPLTAAFSASRWAASVSLVGCAGTVMCAAAARTGPFVPGVQARTSATSGSFTGETMCADRRSFAHPG